MSDELIENMTNLHAGIDQSDVLAVNGFVAVCNRIASLEAELKQREWISVEDRLPENDNEVYIYPEVELQNYHNSGYYCPNKKEWTIIEYNQYGCDSYNPSPTHWMPLPSPPQEQDNG